MSYPLTPTASPLATRAADLWQAEEAIGYRLDAWLLAHLRDARPGPGVDASTVRRDYSAARRALRQHLRALGREVVRLPVVAREPDGYRRPDAAARGLQRLYRDLSRANERLNRLSRAATLHRDYTTAAVLSALHEAQLDTLELIGELFGLGQAQSREICRQQAA